MYFGLSLGLTELPTEPVFLLGQPAAFDVLGTRDGFAIDFKLRRMKVQDSSTPANNFDGNPLDKLTRWGTDDYEFDALRGINISSGRDFSIALDTDLFPYNAEACTVFVKYRLNSAVSTEQRYLVMADNTGTDRLALYSVAGENFRFVSGDGANADIALSPLTAVPDQEYTAVFGVDTFGKTFVDDAGVQVDGTQTLSASTPSHLGIGGYPDRVLRVLDGYISEIVVICEPVEKADRLTLLPSDPGPESSTVPSLPVFDVLGQRNGFAIDFVAREMRINDSVNPSNSYVGDPEARLTNFGSDPYEYDPVKGLKIDASRDFSIGLATSIFPFNPNACSVYAKFRLNAATSAEQRYVFMIDNAGTDRFALYSVPGQPFRFVSGDGATADVVVSDLAPQSDFEHVAVFGVDHLGKSFVDDNGVQDDTPSTLATSVPNHVGIGGYNDRVLRVLDGYITEIAVITEPVQREARLTVDPFFTVYKAEGDSHTFNNKESTWGVAPGDFYVHRVTDALGVRFLPANYGWSGDSSSEMVFQLPDFFADGRPDIATIYAGANDGAIPIVSDTVPTPTQFSVQSNLAERLAVGGFVIINGETAKVTSRSGNLITLDTTLPTAPLVGDVVAPDTQRNIEIWIDEVSAYGVTKIAVVGYHFMNFSSGGDTPTAEHPSRQAIRAKQRAAALSRGVPYIDTYAHMAAKIYAGQVTLGDDLSWHVDISNTHLNVDGEQAVADAIVDAFVTLGWNQ